MQRSEMTALPLRIYAFYRDGFRAMRLGRTLWAIIIIKLIIIFGILKIHYFPDYLETNFPDDRQRAAHVLDRLSETKK